MSNAARSGATGRNNSKRFYAPMVTEAQAAEWILDCDGSCRDVTFTPTSKDAIVAFVKMLLLKYRVTSASDNNGIDRSQQLHTDNPLGDIGGYVHIVLECSTGMIPHLQLFIDEEPDSGDYCLEATFFPNDIDVRQFSIGGFRSLIDNWNEILNSDDYFVRYENASWKLYDAADLGVIYSRKRPPSG